MYYLEETSFWIKVYLIHQHLECQQVALIKFVSGSKWVGMMTRAVVQRDLKRLEECADRNPLKFSCGRCRVLLLGRKRTLKQWKQGTDWLGFSSVEKTLGPSGRQ